MKDEFGEVDFHLIPFADPSLVPIFLTITITSYENAMKKLFRVEKDLDKTKRHVFIGHAFVTPDGEEEENTSESERPLAIGGVESVDAELFKSFDYTALGHVIKPIMS